MADEENNHDSWVTEDVDLDKPSAARMYDYLLGGYHNFAIDREMTEKFLAIYPDAALATRANRAFLRRAVQFLARQGIEQYLDLGSGIPTVGHVHEVAQAIVPDARVVYVDLDPVAVIHSEAMLRGNGRVAAIQADLHEPEVILNHARVRELIDFTRPLGVLLVAVLHFIQNDAQAHAVMHTLRDAVPPGSYLVNAHSTYDGAPPNVMKQIETLTRGINTPARYRTGAEIMNFFDGLQLVDPGLVYTPQWHPDGPDDLFLNEPERSLTLAGVALKP